MAARHELLESHLAKGEGCREDLQIEVEAKGEGCREDLQIEVEAKGEEFREDLQIEVEAGVQGDVHVQDDSANGQYRHPEDCAIKIQRAPGESHVLVGSIPELKFLKSAQKALVELSNIYGVGLTLLASVTFMGFLQPPGAFTVDGYARSTLWIHCFFSFNSLSFFLAMVGIGKMILDSPKLPRQPILQSYVSSVTLSIPDQQPGPCLQSGKIYVDLTNEDDSKANLLFLYTIDLRRTSRRIGIYLALSLITCTGGFVSAGFAVLGPNFTHKLPILIAVVVSLALLMLETMLPGSMIFKTFLKA